MKKKMWFVLCIMTSVLLTTACGEKKEPGEEKKETAVQTETTMQTETAVQTETESDQDFQGRESLKLGLFTVTFHTMKCIVIFVIAVIYFQSIIVIDRYGKRRIF